MISSNPRLLLVGMPAGKNSLLYPLGLDYLSSHLRSSGVDVTCLDLALSKPELEQQDLLEVINNNNFDVIGFSLRNLCDQVKGGLSYPPILAELIKLTRKSLKLKGNSSTIAVGGAGASLSPTTILQDCGPDLLISGDGEDPLLNLCIQPRSEPSDSNLTCTSSNCSPIISIASKMKEITYTRGSWATLDPYLSAGCDGNIQTKRGCNQKCRYCSYPVIEGASVRLRNPDVVAEEFVQLEKLGFRKIFIVDGVFNNPPRHAKRVLQALIDRKTKAEWTAFLSPKFIDRELLELIKASNGGKHIKITIESGSDKVLAALEKGFCTDDIIRATNLCREMEVPFSFTIIFGGPDEDRKTISDTCKLIRNQKPIYVSASIGMYIYPQTPLAKMTKGTLWQDERELMGQTIYPVESALVRAQIANDLSGLDFPIYVHE